MSERPPVIKVRKATPPYSKIIDLAKYEANPDAYEVWRDPLDHDGDGRKGGAPKPTPDDDLPGLRASYESAFGKRPFMGWDAETLRTKIAERGPSE